MLWKLLLPMVRCSFASEGKVQEKVEITSLSQAITEGSRYVKEDFSCWLIDKPSGEWRGCAVGTAAYALGYRDGNNEPSSVQGMFDLITERLGVIAAAAAIDASKVHIKGTRRAEIADMLRQKGL